eukprot:m.249544 g.249544  ORF g.249544 m.249544 type:complete len:202 (+) comp26687_c2_seq2:43-648(+)
MEFPTLEVRCTHQQCLQRDFLPFTCDLCCQTFCADHQAYEHHDCPKAHEKNTIAPTCPSCQQIIAIPRGADPNVIVDEHIRSGCPKTKNPKTFVNRCHKKGCKKKELMPLTCVKCQENFCLRHRFAADHACPGRPIRNKLSPLAKEQAKEKKKKSSKGNNNSKKSSTGRAAAPPTQRERYLQDQYDQDLQRALAASLRVQA